MPDSAPGDIPDFWERVAKSASPKMLRGFGGSAGFLALYRLVPDVPGVVDDYTGYFFFACAAVSGVMALFGVRKGD